MTILALFHYYLWMNWYNFSHQGTQSGLVDPGARVATDPMAVSAHSFQVNEVNEQVKLRREDFQAQPYDMKDLQLMWLTTNKPPNHSSSVQQEPVCLL